MSNAAKFVLPFPFPFLLELSDSLFPVLHTKSLCRNVSKTMKGEPFRPIKCVGVDMFPGTSEMEVVMVFERGPLLQQSIPSDDLFVEQVKETMLPSQPK